VPASWSGIALVFAYLRKSHLTKDNFVGYSKLGWHYLFPGLEIHHSMLSWLLGFLPRGLM
jgi:hypothetical protein